MSWYVAVTSGRLVYKYIHVYTYNIYIQIFHIQLHTTHPCYHLINMTNRYTTIHICVYLYAYIVISDGLLSAIDIICPVLCHIHHPIRLCTVHRCLIYDHCGMGDRFTCMIIITIEYTHIHHSSLYVICHVYITHMCAT